MAVAQDDNRSESSVVIAVNISKAVSLVWNSYVLEVVVC